MSTTTAPDRPRSSAGSSLHRGHGCPRWAPALVAVVALAAAAALPVCCSAGARRVGVLAAVVFLVALPAWSRVVESPRGATDRLMTALVWTAFGDRARAAGLADLDRRRQGPAARSTRPS